MRRSLSCFCVAVLTLGIGVTASAAETERSLLGQKSSPLGFAEDPQPVDVRLVLEHEVLAPGTLSRIGVLFEMEKGWHIYAEDPGDAGIPTRVEWLLPEGFSAGPLIWPPYEDFLDLGDIRTFAYSGEVLLSSTLQAAPEALQQDDPEIHAAVAWLACKEICIPGEATLSLKVVIGQDAELSEDAALFGAVSG